MASEYDGVSTEQLESLRDAVQLAAAPFLETQAAIEAELFARRHREQRIARMQPDLFVRHAGPEQLS